MDHMKSPENLDDYIRVSNPGVWLLLGCVMILLIGACIWGALGHIDSTVPVIIHVENGDAVCCVQEKAIADAAVNMTVRFEGNEAVIAQIGEKESVGYICPLHGKFSLPDGYYEGKLVVSSYKPLSFIIN